MIHGLTIKSKGGLLNVIISDIHISLLGDPKTITPIKGIWDTGATATVITQNVVNSLKLIPTGKTLVNTASENNKLTDTFLVDVILKMGLTITGVKVTLGTILPGVDCLIGMDIITLGDLSLTNFHGTTCMSFRVPSQHELNFVQEINKKNRRDTLYKTSKKGFR